jgi:isoquinoline 1-oxidoreductase beta subunit
MKRGRRNFLIAGGIVAGGIAVGFQFGVPYLRQKIFDFLSDGSPPGGGVGEEPTLWLELTQDNKLVVHVPKVEMGQGVHTALGQIAAEELELPWEAVRVVQASTLSGPVDSFGTGGSASISGLYQPLRQLAANYRKMLELAAEDALEGSVKLQDGVFSATNGATVTLGEVSRLDRDWAMPEEDAPLKSASDFNLIGRSVPRVDIRDILTGVPRYAYDARSSEGPTYYGSKARAPMIGATLGAVNSSSVEKLPDVVKVVVEKDFVGVIANTREAAWLAADELEIKWNLPKTPVAQEQIDKLFETMASDPVTLKHQGDTEALSSRDAIEASYTTPFAATAPLEPQSSFAEMGTDNVLRVKTPTQFPNTTAKNIAKALDIEDSRVDVLPTYLGGGFGRRSVTESAVEASILAYSSGLPVHVGWRREDEFRYDLFRPPTRHQLRGLLKQNHIHAFHHLQASGDVLLTNLPAIAGSILGSDFGATRGVNPQYEIENLLLQAKRVSLPVPTASWRGLGLLANTFALESFVDELATADGQDPLQFRLRHLTGKANKRIRRALLRVSEISDWDKKRKDGVALGIACCIDYGTVVAQVAEAEVSKNRINVRRVWAVMDCGQVVNPNGAINQVEGNIVWGVGSALKEEVTFQDGNPTALNFDRYPLLSLAETPELHVELLPSELPPQGVGEPAIGPVPAAIANSVFASTGKRIRSLPLKL